MDYDNLTLMTDFYQITMMQGYFETKKHNQKVVFDLFYRNNPNNNGYAIVCGLEQAISYINNIKFSKSDIEYLKGLDAFKDDFLDYLKDFKFTGEIYAIPEGSVVFPYEPLVRVKAPIIEAQLIETALLNIINHQSLIATKAARVVQAAQGDDVMEFGLRRAQGPDAGIYGARAAIIGGCSSTSNVIAGKMFDVPISGTHAHSWVMSFEDELTAFREYAKIFPDKCILLVDTFDTLKSGVPNAIKIFDEMKGKSKCFGIRLDSGDFSYISSKARKMLDDAGYKDAIICASSDLDENIISSLKQQNAAINLWGVGTNLITSKDCPAFGGVYKLSAEENEDGVMLPKIKLSENLDKITNPGIKKVFRLYDKMNGKIKADLIALEDEKIDENKDLTIFHPMAKWKRMTLKANKYTVREMLVPVFIDGKCVYKNKTVMEIQKYCKNELNTLWSEHKRLINPQILPVDLSAKLYNLKEKMIEEIRK